MKRPTRPLPRRVVLLVLGLLAIGGLAAGIDGTMRVMAMQRELAALEADIARLHAQARVLTETVERMRTDPLYIEKLAREDLGYVRAGETVLKFPKSVR